MTVMEAGARWMNVLAHTTPFDTKYYLLALVKVVVDGGLFPSYARTDEERAFFLSNNVTTAANPLFRADLAGYNTGNELLGLTFALSYLLL